MDRKRSDNTVTLVFFLFNVSTFSNFCSIKHIAELHYVHHLFSGLNIGSGAEWIPRNIPRQEGTQGTILGYIHTRTSLILGTRPPPRDRRIPLGCQTHKYTRSIPLCGVGVSGKCAILSKESQHLTTHHGVTFSPECRFVPSAVTFIAFEVTAHDIDFSTGSFLIGHCKLYFFKIITFFYFLLSWHFFIPHINTWYEWNSSLYIAPYFLAH